MPPAFFLPGGVEVARVLSRHAVDVRLIFHGRSHSSRASRYVSDALAAPKTWDDRMDAWFDSRVWPNGSVIIPTDDDSAWWLANRFHSGRSRTARLATPGPAPVRSMITKWRLFEVCADARVETPSTWIVEGNEIPEGFRLTGRFPVVLKPQSRVGLMHWTRGRLCRNAAELSEAIAWFRESVRPSPWALADEPRAGDPLIQEFIARPGHEVYHLVGYRSKAGESVIAAHRKLLQYPLRFGSGLCFETAEVDGRAADKLERLLGGIGFHGIFEAEYVERDGELLLIDLNPRAYNGMSLETRRGFDLPWYLYLDALGESALLSEELATARALPFTRMVWRDSVRFWTMLAGQTLSGGLSLRETRRWIAWARANRGGIMDPYFVADDKRAGFGFIRDFVGDAFTEPRAFVGNYVRRGLDR